DREAYFVIRVYSCTTNKEKYMNTHTNTFLQYLHALAHTIFSIEFNVEETISGKMFLP
ncbi:hypothetical protein L9F63_002421, partial [Diploptera punctata]